MKRNVKCFLSAAVILVMMLTCILPAYADSTPTAPIVYVATDGSGDFNCDGGDNDQVEIQQAIDFVLANKGYTTIHLKAGTYVIDDTIYIAGKKDEKVILEGEEGTVVLLSPSACWAVNKSMIENKTAAMVSGTDAILGNFVIRGFKLDGNGPNIKQALSGSNVIAIDYPNTNGKNYYNLIYLQTCNDIEVYNMYLTHGCNDGLQVKTCTNVEYHDNIIDEIGHDGLYAYKCDYVNAYNNLIYIQTNSGLRASSTNHVKFYNNVISAIGNKGGPGIEIQKENCINNANGYHQMTDIEVFNNVIYDVKYAGIWIFGNATAPQYQFQPEDTFVHVYNNIIYNCGYYEGANDAASNIGLKGGIVTDGFNALIENNVIDGCGAAGINVHEWLSTRPSEPGPYTLTIRNNIISNTKNNSLVKASGDEESGYGIYYELGKRHNFIVEYNCFYNNNGADFKNFTPDSATGNLFDTDPCFVDPENHDYHLKSQLGRWNGTEWVIDDVTSPCIDAGAPDSDYTNEPADNGGRINIGAYGNTAEASLSVKRAAAPVASLPSGTYEEPLTTTLTTVTEGAVIYYTTDGTEPTTESMVYTEPIKIEPFKTVIKAVAYKEGVFPSNVVTYEYIIDPTVGLDEMVDQIQELMGNLEDESAYKQIVVYKIIRQITEVFNKLLDAMKAIIK